MRKTYQCEFCNRTIVYTNIGRHRKACSLNPSSEKCKKQNKERACEKCGRIYILANVTNGTERFCSRSCANTRIHSDEDKLKISKSLKVFYEEHPKGKLKPELLESFCIACNKQIVKNKSGYCRKCIHLRPVSEETREKLQEAGKRSAQTQRERRRSKIEALFFEKIKKIFNDAESNKILVDGWDTDIFLPTQQIAIFWNGPCHYYPIYGQKSLNQTQNRDRIKRSLFEKAGYKVYIIKDVNEDYPKEILKDKDKRTEFQLDLFLRSLS